MKEFCNIWRVSPIVRSKKNDIAVLKLNPN